MWLRGPGRSATPHLQYLRLLVMRPTTSLCKEPSQVEGCLHKPCSEHTSGPCLFLQTWDMALVAGQLLINHSWYFLVQKNNEGGVGKYDDDKKNNNKQKTRNRQTNQQIPSTRLSDCDFYTLAQLFHSTSLITKPSDMLWYWQHS